ncbi:MAG: protein-L-isoaspartate O-methyltransferase, partial [Magnetospirillum sp.]|nr:protein-L-isoaspartate O-methyltransferase [Magnetospirillum sp.]
QAPFDRIIVTAAAQVIPPDLADQLKVGGIMVVPVGDVAGLDQALLKITRLETGLQVKRFLPVRFVPLVQGIPPEG